MTLLEMVLRFLTADILLTSGITVSLALFRVPLKNNFIKIVLIGFVMEVISFYFEFNWENHGISNYDLLLMIIAEILLVSFLFNLPYLYCILICIFGFLGSFPVLIGVTLIVTQLGISSDEVIDSNLLHLYLFRLTNSIILFSLAFLFQSKKIGFILKVNQFQIKNINKGFYIGLFLVIWVGVFIIHFTSFEFQYNSLLFFIYCAIFISGMVVAYKLNKKHIREKYDKK